MDKEEIKRAAEQAVNDLQLDCQVTDITRPLGKDTWCIQFTGSYGQFCDEFHDKAGKDNSARVVREKIKRYFLKQRKPVRIVRGRTASTRRRSETSLIGTLIEAGEQVLKQASQITNEVIERTTNLNRAALQTGAEWVEGVSPTAAELVRPESKGARSRSVEPPEIPVEPVSHDAPQQPASRTVITRPKPVAETDIVATTKARTAKASQKRATKKAAAKKTAAKKSASKKRTTKSVKKTSKKKTASKKKRAGKSQGKIKLLF